MTNTQYCPINAALFAALLQCDCKKTHKTRYYVVKYKKTKCH